MTQRSVLTTQSKLTVQTSAMGCGVPAKSAILQEGLIRAKTVSSGALAAVYILVHCPVSGVGRLNGSLLICLRKDVALVSHCVPGLGRGDEKRSGRRHILCAPSFVSVGEGTVLRLGM